MSDISRHPLFIYGTLELLIGIYALFFPLIYGWLTPLYLSLSSGYLQTSTITSIRFFIGIAVLIPPALIGGTLPPVVRFAAGRSGYVGRSLASLYSINTIGAVAGCFLAGFFLIGAYGVTVTMEITAGVNVLIAALVFSGIGTGVWKGSGEAKQEKVSRKDIPRRQSGKPLTASTSRLIMIVVFISGFVSLAYEVIWTRMLIHFTGTTTYAFTSILVTFLMGLGVGSAIARVLLRRTKNRWMILAAIQALIGISAALSTNMIDLLSTADFHLLSFLSIPSTGQWQSGLLLSLIKNSIVLFLPALFMGISLPLAVGIVRREVNSAGKAVGALFSLNTIGSIAGSFMAGFIMIPLLGTGWSVSILVILNMLLSLLLILFPGDPDDNRRRSLKFAVGVFVMMIILIGGTGKSMYKNIYAEESLVFFAEGPSSTVAVVSDEDPLNPHFLRMFVNGNGLSGTDYSGQRYMKLLGHLPVILSGGAPTEALVICLGTGMTLGAVNRYPSLERIDCVEISPEVVEAVAAFATENGNVLQDPRVNILIGDGRNYLMTTSRTYDLITLEPPPPRSAGVVNLYSREFYQLAAHRLSPGGVLCQWIPLHNQSEEDIKALIRTFMDVFPSTNCWLAERNELILTGSMLPHAIDMKQLDTIFQDPAVATRIAECGRPPFVGRGDGHELLHEERVHAEQVLGVGSSSSRRTRISRCASRFIPWATESLYSRWRE